MPRAVAKKIKEPYADVAIWTMVGAYVLGMVVASGLWRITLVPSTSLASQVVVSTQAGLEVSE